MSAVGPWVETEQGWARFTPGPFGRVAVAVHRVSDELFYVCDALSSGRILATAKSEAEAKSEGDDYVAAAEIARSRKYVPGQWFAMVADALAEIRAARGEG